MTIRGAGVYGGMVEAAGFPRAPGQPLHNCSRVAVVGNDRFPCRSHAGGVHHFAAHWPECVAPFCKLPPDHRGLHDIPAGIAEYVHG